MFEYMFNSIRAAKFREFSKSETFYGNEGKEAAISKVAGWQGTKMKLKKKHFETQSSVKQADLMQIQSERLSCTGPSFITCTDNL